MPSPQNDGPIDGVRDLVVGDEALERAQVRHRAQEVVTTDADAEAVGPRVDERQDAIQRAGRGWP